MNDFGKDKKKRKTRYGQKPYVKSLMKELHDFFQNEREKGRIVSNQIS